MENCAGQEATTHPDSLIIFDWDDTVMPTAALAAGGRFAAPPPPPPPVDDIQDEEANDGGQATQPVELQELRPSDEELAACAEAASKALEAAGKYGKVIILTNAVQGWVFDTASRFMPQLLGDLKELTIISARSIFEPLGITEPWRWKALCMQRILDCYKFDRDGIDGTRNLVSIGDSWHERAAAILAAQDLGFPCHVKCLKLQEAPLVGTVARQMDLCAHYFEWLVAHDGHLDLKIMADGSLEPVEVASSRAGEASLPDSTHRGDGECDSDSPLTSADSDPETVVVELSDFNEDPNSSVDEDEPVYSIADAGEDQLMSGKSGPDSQSGQRTTSGDAWEGGAQKAIIPGCVAEGEMQVVPRQQEQGAPMTGIPEPGPIEAFVPTACGSTKNSGLMLKTGARCNGSGPWRKGNNKSKASTPAPLHKGSQTCTTSFKKVSSGRALRIRKAPWLVKQNRSKRSSSS